MQSLRDQLVQTGVVTKQRQRQIEQEKRRERKQQKKGQVEDAQLAQQRQTYADRLAAQRAADRQRAAEQRTVLEAQEQRHRIRQIVDYWHIPEEPQSTERWYFETRHNTIAHIYVSDPVAVRLRAGDLAIVERPDTEEARYVLVPQEAAAHIAPIDRQYIRFTNSTVVNSPSAEV